MTNKSELVANVVPGDGSPKGALYYWGWSYYKIGRFERLFRWDTDEWIYITMTLNELATNIKIDNNRLKARYKLP